MTDSTCYLQALNELLNLSVIYGDHDGHLCVGRYDGDPFEGDLSPETRETIFRLIRERGDL